MGNRYTETSLTARELAKLYTIEQNLEKILKRNLMKSNPDRQSLSHILKAKDNIARAIGRVEFQRGRN